MLEWRVRYSLSSALHLTVYIAEHRGDLYMAKTKSGKKIVPVKPYRRSGKKVKPHRRSTPN